MMTRRPTRRFRTMDRLKFAQARNEGMVGWMANELDLPPLGALAMFLTVFYALGWWFGGL